MASNVSGSVGKVPNPEKKDDDETVEYSPFAGLDKGVLLQESRMFSDSNLNAKKCVGLLTKILYMLGQGERFTRNEGTEVFFGVTKLFQSKDISLRRMVYLVIKELTPSREEVIIVTSCLTKDMTSKTDMYRANAIRVLSKILDGDMAMLTQIERYLKQAIVDKNPFVASAALVSGIHLMKHNSETVKRWANEVQECTVNNKNGMVQYHALALMHQIKQHDRLAISKLVASMTKASLKSPLAQCLLIRYISKVIRDDVSNNNNERPHFEFLEFCLRHKNEMVIYEAARAICNLPNVTPRELTPAITVLQLLLSSPKPVLRFAAVRTLNKVAMSHPLSVTTCNLDMETLISDSNRSIATLAITTLLKTGSEASVERLMKQISNFISEIADEFKIVVVDAIRSLCLKFPQKYRTLMTFLSTILREEGGFEYKKAIVDSILTLINEISEAREPGLSHLCEFIEDCEFTLLSTQILHVLGKEGPSTQDASKFIRYIYNRVILENATVRASAVTALAKFGLAVPSIRPSIIVLLNRCLNDNDDEVRDRATLYLNILQNGAPPATKLLTPELPVPLGSLEVSLRDYRMTPTRAAFDVTRVPILSETEAAEKLGIAPPLPSMAQLSQMADKKPEAPSAEAAAESFAQTLAAMPQFAHIGKLFKSSKPVQLTESETEYGVHVIKHIFTDFIVFQFNIENTLNDQLLEKVTVKMDLSGIDGLTECASIPCDKIPYGTPGVTYVLVRKQQGVHPSGTIGNTMQFLVHDVDPATHEPDPSAYPDEYQLEEFELNTADSMQKIWIGDFRKAWETAGDAGEIIETYTLSSVKSAHGAVQAIIEFLGMQPCEGTDNVSANARTHTLLLSGLFVGFVQVLVQAQIAVDAQQNVNLKLAIRSDDPTISEFVASSVA
mmetsp:Transcript_9303/g.16001  ORF Transcript_9303/g.16001 Transcript_9303/m.16001 type:complete len:900 (+) Transcript_9303:128-2827(+)|eukprot:CAMPEP_0196657536 /NCGR_PEP_ID=MMETSP1086-20130531/24054_1 /TAXON_ID=77921 /ORGANISM="Cyanoptyche  gloeocystis , Strain SAG4.97" /LENGTH=899 /DNA_ID=CAMNT_0041990717 /DNA_START=112 /DNA_END=2811 /DNA_ORIENTATION=+